MFNSLPRRDYPLFIGIFLLLLFGIIILGSIAPFLFPLYFLYLILALIAFWLFIQFDFEVISLFSRFFYVGSIAFLILPLIIGQVTRGAIRWIPLGPLTIQPAEIVRPFLLVFFAVFLTEKELTIKRIVLSFFLFIPPFILIAVQPSLGVAILTAMGFLGVILASSFNKRYLFFGVIIFVLSIPVIWNFLAPYQKGRVTSFLNVGSDPLNSGYNSIQSTIAVGGGEFLGRGLGKGIQTQLAFLPERHTDFIFAGTAEELGFLGAMLLILGEFFVLVRLTSFMENAVSIAGRAYLAGFFVSLFAQITIHIGMNMGILPITGVPLPLVSAGGSSLLATMTGLAIALSAKKG